MASLVWHSVSKTFFKSSLNDWLNYSIAFWEKKKIEPNVLRMLSYRQSLHPISHPKRLGATSGVYMYHSVV